MQPESKCYCLGYIQALFYNSVIASEVQSLLEELECEKSFYNEAVLHAFPVRAEMWVI